MPPSPDGGPAARGRSRVHVDGHDTRVLSGGWQVACSPARAAGGGGGGRDIEGLEWMPARVPGTAAGALADAGRWRAGEPHDFDAQDWWFRTSFQEEPAAPGEEVVLRLDGIATVAEVYLDGELVLDSDSMFATHELALDELLAGARAGEVRPSKARPSEARPSEAPAHELAIRCRALAPLLGESRRPRARWRTRLVPERNLRFFRTMLIGRAPGFAPGPAAVGPWRPVRVERRRRLVVEQLELRPRMDGGRGVLSIRARLRPLDGERLDAVEARLDGPSGAHSARLELSGPAAEPTALGELSVPEVERWWPHTHGEPALHEVHLVVGSERSRIRVEAGRVGFRELAFSASPTADVELDGLDLHVNGVRVFARGAVWTPIDPVDLAPSAGELRTALVQARAAGMNMLRLPGTGAYEAPAFHDLCDELGMLVWQDFMFANFDYPIADERFRASVEREAGELLEELGGRPSLAVVCGNSEVEQQVAMLGLDPSLGRGELFGELLPRLVRDSGVDAVYVPSAPCGGELPFRPDRGIANYYGVGGYRRPLEDARRAGVRFAAECLAFSNVPSGAGAERPPLKAPGDEAPVVGAPGEPAVENLVLSTGIPRDVGADWDFKDVRDHYLGLLFGLDPRALEREDPERYLELARAATGEVMAEVFGEWRRAGSPCRGGLVLWLRDLLPGAGWGVIDDRGIPKLAYHHLRRALAPVAVWTVDEGLGGVVAHVANDGPLALGACLRVALYRDRELRVEQAVRAIELEAHDQGEWNVESVIGRFVDASWAYRFGPPAQDAIVVSLERDDGPERGDGPGRPPEVLSRALRLPAGRALERESPEQLGLAVRSTALEDGAFLLEIESRRLAYGVRVDAPGFLASDDGFFIEPAATHTVTVRPIGEGRALAGARLAALNMRGHLQLPAVGSPS
jgi:beta-mannosidase